jgi:hypothetical protein
MVLMPGQLCFSRMLARHQAFMGVVTGLWTVLLVIDQKVNFLFKDGILN